MVRHRMRTGAAPATPLSVREGEGARVPVAEAEATSCNPLSETAVSAPSGRRARR